MSNLVHLKEHRDLRKLRDAVLVPFVPSDLRHDSDGTWNCSASSLSSLELSFLQFGFKLDRCSSFDCIQEHLSFMLRAASLINALGLGWVEEKHSREFVQYLRAVQSGDATETDAAVKLLVASGTAPSTMPVTREPHLTLVR